MFAFAKIRQIAIPLNIYCNYFLTIAIFRLIFLQHIATKCYFAISEIAKMGIFEVYAAAAAGNKKKERHSGVECLSIV
jgi:hypothetical protein